MNNETFTQTRPYAALLRALRAAGWDHIYYVLACGCIVTGEHVWRRNEYAANQQQIELNDGMLTVQLDERAPVTMPIYEPELLLAVLTTGGVFEPAPKPIRHPRTAAEAQVERELLSRVANDPTIDDDTFIVISRAVDGREIV